VPMRSLRIKNKRDEAGRKGVARGADEWCGRRGRLTQRGGKVGDK
jgi:hypothetical protein